MQNLDKLTTEQLKDRILESPLVIQQLLRGRIFYKHIDWPNTKYIYCIGTNVSINKEKVLPIFLDIIEENITESVNFSKKHLSVVDKNRDVLLGTDRSALEHLYLALQKAGQILD